METPPVPGEFLSFRTPGEYSDLMIACDGGVLYAERNLVCRVCNKAKAHIKRGPAAWELDLRMEKIEVVEAFLRTLNHFLLKYGLDGPHKDLEYDAVEFPLEKEERCAFVDFCIRYEAKLDFDPIFMYPDGFTEILELAQLLTKYGDQVEESKEKMESLESDLTEMFLTETRAGNPPVLSLQLYQFIWTRLTNSEYYPCGKTDKFSINSATKNQSDFIKAFHKSGYPLNELRPHTKDYLIPDVDALARSLVPSN